MLRCAPGLRYGRFDPQSGKPLPDGQKINLTNRAIPYWSMIQITRCSGSIDISNIELDGNLQRLVVGGRYGRGGWQAGGSGLSLAQNSGPERLSKSAVIIMPRTG